MKVETIVNNIVESNSIENTNSNFTPYFISTFSFQSERFLKLAQL